MANMYKLFGLTYLMEESRNDAISCFDKALRIFKEIKSYHGQAATYYLKSLAVKIIDYEDEYNNVNSDVESKKLTEKAMLYYKLLHHKEGYLKCAELIGSRENPPNKVMDLEKLHDPHYVPFIQRESEDDFISLGIEPILTIRFEEDLDFDLLPTEKRRATRISTNIGRIKKMEAMRTNEFFEDDYNDIKVTKGLPKESKTIGTDNFQNLEKEKPVRLMAPKFKFKLKNKKSLESVEEVVTSVSKNYHLNIPKTVEPKLTKKKSAESRNSQSKSSHDNYAAKSANKSHKTSTKELLEKRKQINQRYTFKTIRGA